MGAYTVNNGKIYGLMGFDKFLERTLSECTPAEIQMVAKNGSVNSDGDYVYVSGSNQYKFSVGDKVGIAISACTIGAQAISAGTYYAFIIGFNHNSTYEGTNRIHFQLYKDSSGKDYVFGDYSTDVQMNPTNTNAGGWNATPMRQTYLPALLAAMPTEWKNVISDCTKYTDNTGNSSNVEGNVTATSDKLWLLSEFEVFGSRSYANQYEQNKQKQYDYYKNGNPKVRYASNNSADYWWLRSPCYNSAGGFCYVYYNGNANYGIASTDYGVAPGFTIS